MGLFRKPIRALDRLPSRFRSAPAKSAAQAEPGVGRPDFFTKEPKEPGARAGGPGNAVTGMIVLLSLALLAAIVLLWRTAAGGPNVANGAPTGKMSPGQSIPAVLAAARSYADQQEFGKAEAILDAAVVEHPDDQELRIALAETMLRQKKLDGAYHQYVRALAIGPREPRIEFVTGTLASQLGRQTQAAEHYQKAQAADPTNAQYPLYLAQTQISQNELEEAKVNLLLTIKLDGQNAVAWGTLAEVLLRQNKLDMAIQNIARARALQPEVTSWKLIEARARNRQGDAEAALLLLKTLDRSEQRTKPVLSLMAECYGMLRRPADAASLYAAASDAIPTDADLAFEAAVWAERSQDRDSAVTYASRAVKLGHAGAEAFLGKLRG